MQIQPILGYFWAIFGLYQPSGPPFGSRPPLFTYPGSAPAKCLSYINIPIFLEIVFEIASMWFFHIRFSSIITPSRVDPESTLGRKWPKIAKNRLKITKICQICSTWGDNPLHRPRSTPLITPTNFVELTLFEDTPSSLTLSFKKEKKKFNIKFNFFLHL